MKSVSMSLFAAFSVLASAGAAHAQAFDGPSVGVQAGWTERKVQGPTTDFGVTGIDNTKDAVTVGGFLGYDKTLGRFVLGGEGGMSFSPSDELNAGTGSSRVTIDPKWSFDLTARAGYLVNPKTLVYLRGGYANERIRTTLTAPTGTVNAAENRDGWLAGAGIERAIIPHVSARLEYRYTDLSEGDGKFDRHQALLGVAYRF